MRSHQIAPTYTNAHLANNYGACAWQSCAVCTPVHLWCSCGLRALTEESHLGILTHWRVRELYATSEHQISSLRHLKGCKLPEAYVVEFDALHMHEKCHIQHAGSRDHCCGMKGRLAERWSSMMAVVYIPMWLWVKNGYPKWNPGKWNQGPKPAVPWCFDAIWLWVKNRCPKWLALVRNMDPHLQSPGLHCDPFEQLQV